METIYKKAVSLMQPHEIGNHESDLYLKVTEVSKRLVDDYEFKANVRRFTSNIDKAAWFDIPFAFDPFWKIKQTKKVKVKFRGVDRFNRPVFRDINSTAHYGSVNILFHYEATEAEVLKRLNVNQLEYFGEHFGCEPMGGLDKNIQLWIETSNP